MHPVFLYLLSRVLQRNYPEAHSNHVKCPAFDFPTSTWPAGNGQISFQESTAQSQICSEVTGVITYAYGAGSDNLLPLQTDGYSGNGQDAIKKVRLRRSD